MKFCAQCKTGFPDQAETCPTHGGILSEIVDLKPGMTIRGTYRIIRKLGEGGFGAVYLAEHTLMNEQRALKFLSRQWGRDDAFTARFRREVRTLRQVRHKNVVDCGDLERPEDDSLFFSMELVDGPDLRDFLRDASRPFDVRLALALTRGITEGLGAAHAKGMVHRDIKPDNILLARDGDGFIPKIVDFGIVATKESTIAYTQTGSSLLTPPYAAPEQWKGTPAAELDGRADLYALGGVLFEMLTGQTVFEGGSYERWLMRHLNAEPRPPSSLRPELANWKGLDNLALRLLAKDRDGRPKDVAEVLGLIDAVRYVAPVTRERTVVEAPPPREPTVVEQGRGRGLTVPNREPKPRARGFSRRAWFGVLALVLVGAITAAWFWATTLRGPEIRTLRGHSGSVNSVSFSPDSRTLASGSEDHTIKLWDVTSGRLLSTLRGHTYGVDSATFSPDGRTLASGSQDWASKLWDATSGSLLSTLQGQSGEVYSVAFSPDGRTLASGSQTIELWDVTSGRPLSTFEAKTLVFSVAFSPDGRTLASGSYDEHVKLWDVAKGRLLSTLQGQSGEVYSVAFSPDGRTLASGSSNTTIGLWDVASGRLLSTLGGGDTEAVNSVAFSPDGRTLASGSNFSLVKLWDVANGKLLSTFQGHSGEVRSVAFSPDGRTLASAGDDKTVKLWDVSGTN